MDYIRILKDLITIDTSVPPGENYDRTIVYLMPLFQKAGFTTRKIEIPKEHAEGREGRVNLICHRRNPGKPRLIFYAHIDVVPAHGWPAFQPKVENGKIYGRGSADMKGAIPALLMALLRTKDEPQNYDISVMITTDEEVSQSSQLRYLSQYLQPLNGDYFFDLDSSFGYVGIAGLGALQMEIKINGKSVHSGMAHMGENAIEKAIPVLNALIDLKGRVTQRKSRILTHPDSGLEYMVPRLNIDMIHGGLKVNIIPDECVISIDRRTIPEENIEDARKEILETLSNLHDINWEIVRESVIPAPPPCEYPVVDEVNRIMQEVTGEGGKYGEMGSGDLANIVVKEWGGIEFGLGVIRPESNIHGNNEFVYQKDIENLAEIIYRFLMNKK